MISNILKKIWRDKWVFRSIFYTIWFNFHYLPFRQALFLPIWLYKPKLVKCGGIVKICKTGGIKPGMIQLGYNRVSIYPNSGIMWENRGTINFYGSASIGNNSYISTGEKAIVNIGDWFSATTSLKLCSYNDIQIGDFCTIGWDCLIMDTDLHVITRSDGTQSKGYGEIKIGKENWIANNCKILKNTKTPNRVVISANTIISKSCEEFPEYSVIGNKNELTIISHGYLKPGDNQINWNKI